jgi:hypothetical protein
MRFVPAFAASASLALLLGSVSTIAQSAPYGKATVEGIYGPSSHHAFAYNPNSAVMRGEMGSACPVLLHAQHGTDGAMRKVDKNPPEGIGQELHVTLTSPISSGKDSRQIVAARLRVHGTSGKGQLMSQLNLSNTAQSGMDYTRNVTVRLRPGADNEAVGDTRVAGLTAVLQVELSSVTFDDGSMQQFTAADGCRFTPDHLMLIAGR